MNSKGGGELGLDVKTDIPGKFAAQTDQCPGVGSGQNFRDTANDKAFPIRGHGDIRDIAFESEITSLLDFDVQWVWDRIRNPRENSDETSPEQDDFRLILALGFDF